ncbi:MAG: DUF2851 family protein [Kiritimatiellaeota bacterium]|nr:DUF2851 family protein [Kiritimatiellota bacterium]
MFPRAVLYPPGRPAARGVREREPRRAPAPFSERHLQCVWFDPTLRPAALRTQHGEEVRIEDPGVWNLEAGPDFLGAALRIGPEQRRIAGDVEIHSHPADWAAHGHAADPRYARVRVHVTFHPGDFPADRFPPGAVQIALRDALAANPAFAFENIDLTAYPYGRPATAPPCARVLAAWPPDNREGLLAAAGEERLRRRAGRLAASAARGPAQVVYEEVMAALGYKHNKAAFRRLAETLPLRALRAESHGNPEIAYALLLGVAGLLPDQLTRRMDDESRAFVRLLWDAWWRGQERWAARVLPAAAWRLSGLRPLNHPLRRLAAAAVLFLADPTPDEAWRQLAQDHPADSLDRARRRLLAVSHRYWDRRLTFNGKKQRDAAALIGNTRADAILINVFVPFLAARQHAAPFAQALLEQLPAEADNVIVRQMAHTLFGPDAPRSLLRAGLRRQGLLQIFHDFCLNDRSRCAACPFPARLIHAHIS